MPTPLSYQELKLILLDVSFGKADAWPQVADVRQLIDDSRDAELITIKQWRGLIDKMLETEQRDGPRVRSRIAQAAAPEVSLAPHADS